MNVPALPGLLIISCTVYPVCPNSWFLAVPRVARPWIKKIHNFFSLHHPPGYPWVSSKKTNMLIWSSSSSFSEHINEERALFYSFTFILKTWNKFLAEFKIFSQWARAKFLYIWILNVKSIQNLFQRERERETEL